MEYTRFLLGISRNGDALCRFLVCEEVSANCSRTLAKKVDTYPLAVGYFIVRLEPTLKTYEMLKLKPKLA
jgi:hypothetical protein